MPDTDRPAITSPVSRHLVVNDVNRSVAFYRDVLGFDTAPETSKSSIPSQAEVVYAIGFGFPSTGNSRF